MKVDKKDTSGLPTVSEKFQDRWRVPKDKAMSQEMHDEADMAVLLCELGADSGAYDRERRSKLRRMVSEVYSPPRVAKVASELPGYGLLPGFSLDLTCFDEDDGQRLDFDIKAKRDKARSKVEQERPLFLVLSPDCSAWSTWQNLNDTKRDPELVMQQKIKARTHLLFSIQLAEMQMADGRYFLFEHPAFASSWQEVNMQKLMADSRVDRVRADQCQYGSEVVTGIKAGSPVKKPTGFLSNSAEVLKVLSRRCIGVRGVCSRPRGGEHVHCEGSVAKNAARYSRKLCKAMLKGMRNQMLVDGILLPACHGLQAKDDPEVMAVDAVPEGCVSR